MELPRDKMVQYIREHEVTTKKDALKSVQRKLKKYMKQADEDTKLPQTYYALMIVLLQAFYDRISQAVLFDELPDEWIYDFKYEYDSFSLSIEHIHKIEVTDDGEFKSEWPDALYRLIDIKPKALTVEQYSKLYKVEQGTVRQWIRRGKIRAAYKEGNEWKIPELTSPPSRGYETAQYKWFAGIDNLPEEYAYLSDYILATFYQDYTDKSKYHVIFVSKETYVTTNDCSKNKELLLDAKEREKLELFMISHPQIKYCGWLL